MRLLLSSDGSTINESYKILDDYPFDKSNEGGSCRGILYFGSLLDWTKHIIPYQENHIICWLARHVFSKQVHYHPNRAETDQVNIGIRMVCHK